MSNCSTPTPADTGNATQEKKRGAAGEVITHLAAAPGAVTNLHAIPAPQNPPPFSASSGGKCGLPRTDGAFAYHRLSHRQLLNRDLLAESCDQIIVDALSVHDIDAFRGDRAELLDLIRAARVVRDLIRRPVTAQRMEVAK